MILLQLSMFIFGLVYSCVEEFYYPLTNIFVAVDYSFFVEVFGYWE